MTIQDNGTDLPTLLSYYNKCNRNPLCRTFVSDTTWSIVCRLYQGSIDTGTVISSLSSTSRVAGLHYDASLYGVFNQVCDSNLLAFDRYLICTNGSWNCLPTTYWNGSMCINQVYYGASCNTNKICREDIGLICSASCNKCLCHLTTIWNSSSCVPSTCPNVLPTGSSLSALWLLDGNAYDSMNNYNGAVVGRPSFITGYVGQAIALSNNSYIQTSYIDFYRQSFTIELWFYLQNTINDLPLFVECSNTDTDECLHMGLNSYSTLHFGFLELDVDSMTSLVTI